MENMDVNPEAKNASGKPSKMKAIFAAVFAVVLVLGGVYYFVFGQSQSTPPSLGAGDSLYQGLATESGGLSTFEQSEIDAWVSNGEKVTDFIFTSKNKGMIPFYLDTEMTMAELVGTLNPNTTGQFAFVLWGESDYSTGLVPSEYDEAFYITDQDFYIANGGPLVNMIDPEMTLLTIPKNVIVYLITGQDTEMHSDHVFLGDEAATVVSHFDVCSDGTAGWTNVVANADAIAKLSVCPPDDLFRLKAESELVGLETGIVYERVSDLSTLGSQEVIWVNYENDPAVAPSTPATPAHVPVCIDTSEEDYLSVLKDAVAELDALTFYELMNEDERSLIDEMYSALDQTNETLELNKLFSALEEIGPDAAVILNSEERVKTIQRTIDPTKTDAQIDDWYTNDYSGSSAELFEVFTNLGEIFGEAKAITVTGGTIQEYLTALTGFGDYVIDDEYNREMVFAISQIVKEVSDNLYPGMDWANTENVADDYMTTVNEFVRFEMPTAGKLELYAEDDFTFAGSSFLKNDKIGEYELEITSDAEGCYVGDVAFISETIKDTFIDKLGNFLTNEGFKVAAVSDFLDNLIPFIDAYAADGSDEHIFDIIHEVVVLGNGLGFDVTDAQHILDNVNYSVLNHNRMSDHYGNANYFGSGSIQSCEVTTSDGEVTRDDVYVFNADVADGTEVEFMYFDIDTDGDGSGDIESEVVLSNLISSNEGNDNLYGNGIVAHHYLITKGSDADPIGAISSCVNIETGESIENEEGKTCEEGFSVDDTGACVKDEVICEDGYKLDEAGSACVEETAACGPEFFAMENGECELYPINMDHDNFTVSYYPEMYTANVLWTYPGPGYGVDFRYSLEEHNKYDMDKWFDEATQLTSGYSHARDNTYVATFGAPGQPHGDDYYYALKLKYGDFTSSIISVPLELKYADYDAHDCGEGLIVKENGVCIDMITSCTRDADNVLCSADGVCDINSELDPRNGACECVDGTGLVLTGNEDEDGIPIGSCLF